MPKRITYANVMATLAFFLALTGGVVYAADKLGSNDIARNAIKSKHVKADALRGGDIDERTLALPTGPQGAPGAPGAPGAQGEAGQTFGDQVYGTPKNIADCAPTALAELPVRLDAPARLFAYGQSTATLADTPNIAARLSVQLVDDDGGLVAVTAGQSRPVEDSAELTAIGVMQDQSQGGSPTAEVAAGDYTLELIGAGQLQCGGRTLNFDQSHLGFVELGAGQP